MECIASDNEIFVRLDPGGRLVETLIEISRRLDIKFGSIVSGVGMLSEINMGFFDVNLNDYQTRSFQGIHDLSLVCGNITLFDNQPRPHVHIVANRPDYSTISGHLIEATCHITIELFIQRYSNIEAFRTSDPGRPATFITQGCGPNL